MLYAADLRRLDGVVLVGGGRMLLELGADARARGIEVPELIAHPDVDLEAAETEVWRELAKGSERHELAEFLRGEIEVVTRPVPAAEWIHDALGYYRRLGFFAGGLADGWRDGAPFVSDDDMVSPEPPIEGWFLGLDATRVVPRPMYPGWTMEAHARAFVEALGRVGLRVAVRDVRSWQHEQPEWRHAPLGQDHVAVDAVIDGRATEVRFYHESKHVMRIDVAIGAVNRAIAGTGRRLWWCQEVGGVALLRDEDAAAMARDRALVWSDPARVIC